MSRGDVAIGYPTKFWATLWLLLGNSRRHWEGLLDLIA